MRIERVLINHLFIIVLVSFLIVIGGCDTGLNTGPNGGDAGTTDTFSIAGDAAETETRSVVLDFDVEQAAAMRISNRPLPAVSTTVASTAAASTSRGLTPDFDLSTEPLYETLDLTTLELTPALESLINKYDGLTNAAVIETLNNNSLAIEIIDQHPGVVEAVNIAPDIVIPVITAQPLVNPHLVAAYTNIAEVLSEHSGLVTVDDSDEDSPNATVNIRGRMTDTETLDFLTAVANYEVAESGVDWLDTVIMYERDSTATDPVPWTGEGSITTDWLPYSASMEWTLPAGNTQRMVYAQFIDSDGKLIWDTHDDISLNATYEDDLNTYLGSIRIVPPDTDLDPGDSEETGTEEDNSGEDDGMYCQVTSFQARAEYDENIVLNPSTSIIYPGAIIDAMSITEGSYRALSFTDASRGSGTIHVPDVKSIPNVYTTVNEVNPAVVNQAMATLLQQAFVDAGTGSVSQPASTDAPESRSPVIGGSDFFFGSSSVPNQGVTFEVIDAYDEESMSFHLGAEFKYAGAGGAASFDYSNESIKTRLLIRFVQHYYTVDFMYPGSASGFFTPGTTPANVESGFDPGMVPVYVASVKYGRMGYYSLESSMTRSDIAASLEAQYKAGPVEASANFSFELGEVSSESTTKGQIYGGDATLAAAAATDVEKFFDWIAADTWHIDSLAELNTVPISYQLNYLDNNEVARLGFISDYQIRNCYAAENKYTVGNFRLEMLDVKEADKDLYGTISVRAYQNVDTGEDNNWDGENDIEIQSVTPQNGTDIYAMEILPEDNGTYTTFNLLTEWNAYQGENGEESEGGSIDGSNVIQLSGTDGVAVNTNVPVPVKELEFTFNPNMLFANPYIEVEVDLNEWDGAYPGQDFGIGIDTSGDYISFDDKTPAKQIYINGNWMGDHYIGTLESQAHTKFNILFEIWTTGAPHPASAAASVKGSN